MAPWPPPPDLASIEELVRGADVEGFLEDGAPPDEYDAEAEDIHAAIVHLPTAGISVDNLMPTLESVWRESFNLSDAELASRRSALGGLAQQIARFFGPEAAPQTRTGPTA